MSAPPESLLRRWLVPPAFDGEDRTQRARMLNLVLLTVMASITLVMPAIALRCAALRADLPIAIVSGQRLLKRSE